MSALPHTSRPLDAAAPPVGAGIGLDLAALAQTGLGVVQDGVIVYCNQALADLLGWSPQALLGQRHEICIAREFREPARHAMRQCLQGSTLRPGEIGCLRRDGSRFDARLYTGLIEFGGRPAVLVNLFDVSELQSALRRGEWSAGMLARTEALCRTGSFEVDWPSGLLHASRGLCALLGCSPDQPMTIDAVDWIPVEERAYVAGFWRNAAPNEPFEFQHRVYGADGQRLIVLHRGVLNDANRPGPRGVAMLQDITAQRDAEQRIQELANNDEVTGLPNRSSMLDQLDALMHAARWTGSGLALLVVDVPRIAEIKAGMGFGAGDTLAMALAARLKDGCGAGESVAQLGDTEFALVIETGCDELAVDLEARAQDLVRCLQAPVRLGTNEVFSRCLVGMAIFPVDAGTPSQLLEAAQAARLDVKGGSGIAHFRREVSARVRRHMQIESALRHAIEANELSLHYQPQVDLNSGVIRGAEALLRWQSAELGSVPPAEFIPIAESSGLIGAIGEWVLRRSCEQVVAWQAGGLGRGLATPLRVAVNLSPAQLQRPDLASQVQAVLEDTGARGEQLGIELTEGMLMSDIDGAAAVLLAIKALGVEISLDDFGTGYSSLSRLSRLPIDVVKIDRSLVNDVTAPAQQVSLTRAIITMAHGLQMQVLAEGVETEGQLSLLASHGCDQIQGYWFSRPVPPDAFELMLREGKCLPDRFVRRAPRQRTLLLVDDEDNIVSALKRLLRRDGYHIVTASSAAEGLQRLAEQEVDVIVSDQRMPGMTGVEFLHRAKALYPATMRLVLSGYTELQSIIDAVNEGAIYKFLTKPWDDQLLRSHVAEAFRQKELADDNRRLSREVETANADLAKLNERLERLLGEQHEHAALLAAGADGMRGLLDELPLALLGVDPDGLVAYANRHAEHLLGTSGSPLGQSFIDALPPLEGTDTTAPYPPGSCVEVDGERFRILCKPLSDMGQLRGRLLVLLPSELPDPTLACG
jgi:PAS domain S-box-containing protein/diguanylate cyclase (GGDEF)-like protein